MFRLLLVQARPATGIVDCYDQALDGLAVGCYKKEPRHVIPACTPNRFGLYLHTASPLAHNPAARYSTGLLGPKPSCILLP